MDEKAKDILYSQLVEMRDLNINQDEILSIEEYMKLSDKEALKYILEYREKVNLGNRDEDVIYLELPDMDLSGQDLSDIYISDFYPAILDKEGKLIPSKINLENTNVTINIDAKSIGYNERQRNDNGIYDEIINFEHVNFKGCNLYGILPDEYADYEKKSALKSSYLVKHKENLDARYLQRRQEKHLSEKDKKIADRAYERIMNGKILYGMNGIRQGVDFSDYDFSRMKDTQIEVFSESLSYDYEIDIDYANIFVNRNIEKFENFNDFLSSITLKRRQEILEELYSKKVPIISENIDKILMFFPKSIQENIIREIKENGEIEKLKKCFEHCCKTVERNFVKLNEDEELLRAYKKCAVETIELLDIEETEEYLCSKIFYLSEESKERLLNSVIKSGNVKNLKTFFYFADQNDRKTNQAIIEKLSTIQTQEAQEYVEEHFQYLSTEGKKNFISNIVKNGDVKKAKELFYRVHGIEGDTLKEYILNVLNSNKTQEAQDFIENHFEHLSEEDKMDRLAELIDKQDINQIEDDYEYIENEDVKLAIIDAVSEIGTEKSEYFIKEHFSDLSEEKIVEKMNLLIENEDIEKVYKYFDYLIIHSFTDVEIEKKKNVFRAITQKMQELETEGYENFFRHNFRYADQNQKSEFLMQELEKGNCNCINLITIRPEENRELLIEIANKGYEELVIDNLFFDFKRDASFSRLALESRNDKLIKEALMCEGNKETLRGKSGDGKYVIGNLLYYELKKENIDEEIIIKLIKAGSYINGGMGEFHTYTEWLTKAESDNIQAETHYEPILFAALKINNIDSRKRIVKELLKAGADVKDNSRREIRYRDEKVKCIYESILDNKEFLEILEEFMKEYPETRIKGLEDEEEKRRIVKIDSKDEVNQFLTEEVGLDENGIQKLEEDFQKYGRSIYTTSVERMRLQKNILSACNCEKQAFTSGSRILGFEPKVLYARLRFFVDNNIRINPDRVNTTIGISNKGFKQHFGSILLDENTPDYSYRLKRELMSRYPMPKTKDELNKELSKYKEREER